MASGSGWNLWVWLAGGECLVGVVVRRYIHVCRFPHITYPYSSCICSFFAAASLLLFLFLNFFHSCSSTFL